MTADQWVSDHWEVQSLTNVDLLANIIIILIVEVISFLIKGPGRRKSLKALAGENMEVCESMEKEKLRWIGIKRRATQPAFSTFNLNDSTSSSTHSGQIVD